MGRTYSLAVTSHALVQLLCQLRDRFTSGFVIRHVHILSRIVTVVIQHSRDEPSLAVRVFGEPASIRSDRVAALKTPNRRLLPWPVGLLDERDEAAALQVAGQGKTGEFAQGWINVNELRQSHCLLTTFDPWRSDDQRGVHRNPDSETAAIDVFLSYAEEDSGIAVKLAEGLEQAGYRTWYYEEHSCAGRPWSDTVARAIHSSRAFLVVVSKAAENVQKEDTGQA